MSTNIRVDVTLQRLQEQSRQATEQNRRERQEREDARQQSGLTPAGNQNAADDPAAQANGDTTQSSRQTDSSRAKGESPFDERRPAAQRLGTPSIVGIQYRFAFSQAPSGERKITVGVPGLSQQAQHVFTAFPTTNANTNIPVPPAVYDPPGGPNPGLASLGPVPPNADQDTGLIVEYYSFNIERHYDLSIPLCLPLNSKASIFVWDYHYAKHQLVAVRESRRDSQRINPVVGSGATTYSRQNDYNNTYTFDNDDFKVVREIVCFLVTPKGVQKVDTPAKLTEALNSRRPLATKTGTTEILAGSTFQTQEIMTSPLDLPQTVVTIPETFTYQTVPGFQFSSWRPEYTGPGMGLALQFGIGELLSTPHGNGYGPYTSSGLYYFSGSVYQWLTKPMNLSTTESYNYSYIKSVVKDFPGRYISSAKGFSGEVPPTYQDGFETFGIAKKAPENYAVPMTDADFTWTKQFKFPNNGAPSTELAYCWNWDDEQYCRRQLQALGFKNADFVL